MVSRKFSVLRTDDGIKSEKLLLNIFLNLYFFDLPVILLQIYQYIIRSGKALHVDFSKTFGCLPYENMITVLKFVSWVRPIHISPFNRKQKIKITILNNFGVLALSCGIFYWIFWSVSLKIFLSRLKTETFFFKWFLIIWWKPAPKLESIFKQ